MKIRKSERKKSADRNLAVISVILGATSFIYSVFTGIPAIVLGIMALRRNTANPAQAKLGIAFGIIGSLIWIPIIALLIYFLRSPLKQQFSLSSEDSTRITAIQEAINSYKKKYDRYPMCSTIDTGSTCKDWIQLYRENPGLHTYTMGFETESYNVEDRSVGTLVLAYRTHCLLHTPTDPRYLDDDDDFIKVKPEEYASLVYFHNGGRACYSVNKNSP